MARAANSLKDILGDLNDSQREAVCQGDGPLLVIAGAGSGKTRVITRRVAYLIHQGVPPERLLAITFTNKAAEEMRRRVEALVGKGVFVSTFHSFCAWLLRREISRVGGDSSFTIYDRADSARLIRQIVRAMELDPATFQPADLVDYVGLQKDRMVSPEECARNALGVVEQTCAEVYRRYEEALAKNNALDFDDLLLRTLEVFRSCPDVLARYQDAYLHVLVDEYQDTNLPQHLIARGLQGKHHNITAVGDPDQMIYSWRGARLENLLEFADDFPGARIVKLERNYRSTANILRAASACIAHNVLRHEKTLWTDRGPGSPVVVREFGDSYDEARWVAQTVAELMGEGIEPRQIAVFYRTKQQSLPLEDAFAKLSLPHQVVDSIGFFDRREVKDVRAFLQLLVNPRDDVAFQRVFNVPPRGAGPKTLAALQEVARLSGLSLLEAALRAEGLDGLDGRARKAIGSFCTLYRELASLKSDTVAHTVRRLLELTDYVGRVPLESRAESQEVLDMFLGYVKRYDQGHPGGGVVGFLEQAALVSDVDGWNSRANAVPLMTLHSAKGLEFDAVFIVGAEDDRLPHRRALEECAHGDERAALEEERRLFYVGMTRARHRLYISYARRRLAQGREVLAEPSRFLAELPPDAVDRAPAHEPAIAATARDFGREMESVLMRKRVTLRVIDAHKGQRLARGVRVAHPSYGEGVVLEVWPIGRRQMVRVDFSGHGVVALLLAPEEGAAD